MIRDVQSQNDSFTGKIIGLRFSILYVCFFFILLVGK